MLHRFNLALELSGTQADGLCAKRTSCPPSLRSAAEYNSAGHTDWKVLCSGAILARLPLYQFFALSIRHSDPRSTPRGKRQKTAALQKLARVRTGLQIRVLWRFGNQYAETPALPKRDRTIDFNQPSNLNRLSRLPSFLGVMQVHPRLDIVAIFPTRPLLRLH